MLHYHFNFFQTEKLSEYIFKKLRKLGWILKAYYYFVNKMNENANKFYFFSILRKMQKLKHTISEALKV